MPFHNPNRVEFAIDSGHIKIVTDGGKKVPAYWAHPRIGHRVSGICLLHDWWGIDQVSRMLANFFAQMGYYVIEPDLFGGRVATTPQQAMKLYQETKGTRYAAVDATLSVLETHHRVTTSVAAVGVGMGGTLALEAAIKRNDLEAAVSYCGFPQNFLGQFSKSNTPILAVMGSEDRFINPNIVQRFEAELDASPIRDKHQTLKLEGCDHDIFTNEKNASKQPYVKQAINRTLSFLELYLEQTHNRNRPTGY